MFFNWSKTSVCKHTHAVYKPGVKDKPINKYDEADWMDLSSMA